MLPDPLITALMLSLTAMFTVPDPLMVLVKVFVEKDLPENVPELLITTLARSEPPVMFMASRWMKSRKTSAATRR